MRMITRQHIKSLDDKCLLNALVALATTERHCQVELLLHLAEMDDRQLYLGQGYSSLWDYCRRALHCSESISQQRIVVARAARLYPDLLALLGDGRLTLCTAADLIPALTAENATGLMAAASGKSRREVQQLAETKGSKPRERDVIRRLAPAVPLALPLTAPDRPAVAKHESVGSALPAVIQPVAPVKPRHRIAFTASDEVVKKLERIQELQGAATLEDAINRASEALLDQLDPSTGSEAPKAQRKDSQGCLDHPQGSAQ